MQRGAMRALLWLIADKKKLLAPLDSSQECRGLGFP
jgi:hypothetical protein